MPAPFDQVLRERLERTIATVLQQAQITETNHTKNYVTLYKTHLEAAEHTLETARGIRAVGEAYFRDILASYLMRVLASKRGTGAADRVSKFVGGYIKYMNERTIETKQGTEEDEDDSTPASRFTSFLLDFLISGFLSRDKTVRFRVLYTLQAMIKHLGEVDEDTCIRLQDALLERVHDREASVRSCVCACLAEIAAWELDGEISTLEVAVDAMAYDSSAEVRRSILMHLRIDSETLPYIIERTRDTDQGIRRLVYKLLGNKIRIDDEESLGLGPTYPKALTISQREVIAKNGLGDRDNTVKTEATSLLLKWIDAISPKAEDVVTPLGRGQHCIYDRLLPFIKLFDLHADNCVASDALRAVFHAKAEIFDAVDLSDVNYWTNMSTEKIFLARVFAEHCKSIDNEAKLDSSLPEVTTIAHFIKAACQQLSFLVELNSQKTAESVNKDQLNEWEEKLISQEYILAELLRLAMNLDYSDENGRRLTFQTVRQMLSRESLPEALMEPCLDVLRQLSSSEQDLILLIVEIVQDLRDNVIETGNAKPTDVHQNMATPEDASINALSSSLAPEQQLRLDVVDSKCLSLCIGMLERVNGTFEENICLSGVLKSLIIPSAQKQDEELRDKGTKALALCCLIERGLALQTYKFFIGNLSISPPNIRLTLARAIIDICMVHKDFIFKADTNNLEMITAFLTTQISKEEDPDVQAVLCQGAAKMVISAIIGNVEVIKTLLKVYISPMTTGNNALRQALTLFFAIYSHHTSVENQQRMQEIFILIFLDVCEDRRQVVEADEDIEIIQPSQIAEMFLEWTSPISSSKAINARHSRDSKRANECIQLDMAKDIITLLFEKDLKVEIEKEDKRVLCQMLGKCYIPDSIDDYRVRSLKLLLVNLRTRRPLRDSVSKNAFSKFETAISTKFAAQLEHFSEEEFRELEELQDLFMFLDSIVPLDDEDDFEIVNRRKGRKRRSTSVASATTESWSDSTLARSNKGRSGGKRRRMSTPDDEDEGDCDDARPSVPTRTVPKRVVTARKPPQVIVISSDSDECDGPSSQRPGPRARFRPSLKKELDEESELDRDIDRILDGNSSMATTNETSYDSIMGPNSEDEEEEVSGLLAED